MMADPLNREIVRTLHALTDAWSDYAALASTEPAERAINIMVKAGLIEAGGIVHFSQPGVTTRVVVEGRWTGLIIDSTIEPILADVSEWFENGKLRAQVAVSPSTHRIRLTTEGLVAQGDVRSPERQIIVLQALRLGVTEPGRVHVNAKRIERPVPPDVGGRFG